MQGEAAAAKAKHAGELSGAVSDFSLKLVGVFDRAQRNTAELNFQTGLLDIKQRAENDPDYNNSAEYFKEIRKLHDDNLKGIGLPSTRGELSAKFGLQGRIAEIDIDSMFKKKGIDQGRAAKLTEWDNLVANPPEGFEKTLEDGMAEQVESQLFGHVEGQKLVKDYIKQGKSNMFRIDLSVDPALAKQNLKKNKYGFDIQEQEKAEKLYDNEIRQREEQGKELQMNTLNVAGDMLSNRTLTPEHLKAWVDSGAMDVETADNFDLATSSPKEWKERMVTDKGEPVEASNLVTKFFLEPLQQLADSDSGKRKNIVAQALKNHKNKKLNQDELTFVLRMANGKTTEPDNPNWNYLSSAFTALGETAGTKVGERIPGVIKQFISNWNQKDDPRPILEGAIVDQYKKSHPETATWSPGLEVAKYGRKGILLGYHPSTGEPIIDVK